jgi:hypothetical protein
MEMEKSEGKENLKEAIPSEHDGKSNIQQEKHCFDQQIGLKFKNKLGKCYTWTVEIYGAETWIFREVNQKHVESFEV